MSDNDRIVLKTILKQNRDELLPDMSDNDYFEIFAAEQVLKKYDLDFDEIMIGIVGGGNDGGIDSIHVFVNGSLIQEDTDTKMDNFGRNITIELNIIQTKLENGFNETTIQKFDNSFKELFDLSNNLDNYKKVYNENLLNIARKFREIITKNASKIPELHIKFHYVSLGDEPNPNVERLVATLRNTVQKLFSSAVFNFNFITAGVLLNMTRQIQVTSCNMKIAENPISSGEQSFICLINLVEYYHFIRDDEGNLKKHLFEANVRDYQGSIQVNQGIKETLENSHDNEFWWLNNGITVIASKAFLSGKILTIVNPMIVNGMQTSYEIYKHFSNKTNPTDTRNILVRIIGINETPDEFDTRNKVIKATNSQTAIQTASLRATDKIQRDIEDYLKENDFYYDRRKNYYRNERMPYSKIISITYLAQSMISIVIRRPNDARTRPSTLLRDDKEYLTIFNSKYPMGLYLKCINILKRSEEYLKNKYPSFTSTDINNYKFHLSMFSTLLACNNPIASYDEIEKISLDEISDIVLHESMKEIEDIYAKSNLGAYLASKNKDIVEAINNKIKELTFTNG